MQKSRIKAKSNSIRKSKGDPRIHQLRDLVKGMDMQQIHRVIMEKMGEMRNLEIVSHQVTRYMKFRNHYARLKADLSMDDDKDKRSLHDSISSPTTDDYEVMGFSEYPDDSDSEDQDEFQEYGCSISTDITEKHVLGNMRDDIVKAIKVNRDLVRVDFQKLFEKAYAQVAENEREGVRSAFNMYWEDLLNAIDEGEDIQLYEAYAALVEQIGDRLPESVVFKQIQEEKEPMGRWVAYAIWDKGEWRVRFTKKYLDTMRRFMPADYETCYLHAVRKVYRTGNEKAVKNMEEEWHAIKPLLDELYEAPLIIQKAIREIVNMQSDYLEELFENGNNADIQMLNLDSYTAVAKRLGSQANEADVRKRLDPAYRPGVNKPILYLVKGDKVPDDFDWDAVPQDTDLSWVKKNVSGIQLTGPIHFSCLANNRHPNMTLKRAADKEAITVHLSEARERFPDASCAKLSRYLHMQGFSVAPRTVSKYLDEAGIPRRAYSSNRKSRKTVS